MKIVGITGNSGSGKSLISEILLNKCENSIIIDADKVVKKISDIDTPYYKEIVNKFGINILNKTKQINRKKLANIIYNNPEKRQILNKITFEYVVQEIKKQIDLNNNKKLIILDAPLLFESNLNKICDTIIGVIAKYDIKIKRISKRDNINKEDAKKRLKAQLGDDYLRKKCNFVIENNEKVEDIIKQLDKIYLELI